MEPDPEPTGARPDPAGDELPSVSSTPPGSPVAGSDRETVEAWLALWRDRHTDWEKREVSVMAIAFRMALDELAESARLIEPVKTRAAVVFSATFTAMAFLSGSALRDVQPSSIDQRLLTAGVLVFGLFAVLTAAVLLGGKRTYGLTAKGVRNQHVQGSRSEPMAGHLFDTPDVQSQLIDEIDVKVRENETSFRKVRTLFITQILAGAATLTIWSFVVASADPKP